MKVYVKSLYSIIAIFTFSFIAQSTERVVSYQGKVFDAAGIPVNENTVSITVKFYDAQTGGNQLGSFSETHTVNIVNGLFSILIGSKTTNGLPSSIFNSLSPVYLSISVHNEEQLPRPQIVYVPYSMSSYGKEINCADYVGTVDAGGYCIDQNWSAEVTGWPYTAQMACQSRGMRLCTWFEYSYACVKWKNGLLTMYNLVQVDPYKHQHTMEIATTFRGFGHKKNTIANPSCFLDVAAIGLAYYSTAAKIHWRCCISK